MTKLPFDGAIVDLDGTMIDTVGDFEQALGAAFSELGLPKPDRAFISRAVGKGTENLIRRALDHVGASSDLFADASARYQRHYIAINGQFSHVYPGVVEGLQSLQRLGLRLACLTNKPNAFAKPLLADKGLAGYFQHVFGGDAFERKKPDPLPLLKTCEALGLAPARVLMVGDSSNDAQAARAAGCRVVLVSYGYNHGEPVSSAGADRIVDRIDQLEALLAQGL
jgi:phosphoglycolate phosphatase